MLYWLLVLCWVVCGIQILRNTGIPRLLYFFIGIFFVPATLKIIPQALLMGHTFYATMFIGSMIRFREFKIGTFTSCPLFQSLFFVFLSYLLIGIFDFRIGLPMGLLRGVTAFVSSYFLFFVGWISLESSSQADFISPEENTDGFYMKKTFFDMILPATLIITLYGLWTGITHTNPILDAVGLKGRFLSAYMDNYRSFRVTGACISSSVYGLACSTLFLCSFFLTKYRNKVMTFAIFMLFVNIFLSATRAAMIPFLIGLCVFVFINKGLSIMLQRILVGIIVLLFIFPLLPNSATGFVTELADSIVDVIFPGGSGGEKYGGSNVDARGIQIAAALQYLKEKPLFGHGFAYFAEVISQGKKHTTLLGMESYLCFVGVEYGLVYLVAIIGFYTSCFLYFLRNRFYNRLYADLGISLLAMFIPYLIFAWVGGCWFFFMPMLGYVAKAVFISKSEFELQK